MINKEKRDLIIELIKWYALQKEQLDKIIPNLVSTYLSAGDKNCNARLVVDSVKKRVQEEGFSNQFIESFDERFTTEEIKQVVSFYKSDVMNKFLNSQDLFNDIFLGYNTVIQDVVEELSA